ncbi:hypothetical protein LTR66_013675 [Elasticomyces elasticus]|nr:hypothetical protein LTR66_013675 [Elasticomyces elasticus]KAK4984914.1 hypothetical protein LTR50_006320 [Elasticomyces elasticus]
MDPIRRSEIDLTQGSQITCVKSSQGFEWNQELFLPSYIEYDAASLELKQDPIEDITLTEEEVAAMLPQ